MFKRKSSDELLLRDLLRARRVALRSHRWNLSGGYFGLAEAAMVQVVKLDKQIQFIEGRIESKGV